MDKQKILHRLALEALPELSDADFAPASKEEQEQITSMQEAVSYWKDAWRRFKENKIAMVALVIIGVLLYLGGGPLSSPYTQPADPRGTRTCSPCFKH